MIPFVASQIQAIIEDIRLLEWLVPVPHGLYSDICRLRQSMPLSEAADLSREELIERRTSYFSLTDNPASVALQTITHVKTSLAILQDLKEIGGSPLGAEWVVRAGRVLQRAEQKVTGELRAKNASMVRGLYVIVDPDTNGGRPVGEVAEAALKGGASVIRLRDRTHDRGDVLVVARQIKSMCEEHDALFIMNDDPSIARESEAYGLHLGQSDMPVPEARRILAPDQILGRSNSDIDEVAASQSLGVDYLAVGAVFPTATMGKTARPVVGVEMVSKVKQVASQPIVATGGINRDNIGHVVRAGADCICVASAVTLADDPQVAAQALVEAILNAN